MIVLKIYKFVILSFVMHLTIGLTCSAGPPKSIKLPFKYIQSFIIVDLKMEHLIPLNLIFDTGAEHTILFDRTWTDIFSNPYQRDIKIIGSDLQVELPAMLSVPRKLVFSDLFQRISPVIVLKEKSTNISQVIGVPIHGILSAALFSDFVIEIDYKNRNIYLHPRPYEVKAGFSMMDLHMQNNRPFLNSGFLTDNNIKSDKMLLLDTGASLSLLLYRDSSSTMELPNKMIPGFLGSGLGGLITGYVGKISYFKLDSFVIPEVITHFMEIDQGIAGSSGLSKSGLIGNQILDRFHLIIDYTKSKLYLKPNKNFHKKISYDKSGLMIISGGSKLKSYYVANVTPDSPADEIGILPNDQILSVNGISVVFLSLNRIQKILQKEEGKRIKLKLRRGKKKITVYFHLRSLI